MVIFVLSPVPNISHSVVVRQGGVLCVLVGMASIQAARRFASVMTRGFPRYGCRVKSQKTCVNFKMAIPRRSNQPQPGHAETVYLPQLPSSTVWLRWCGLRLHTRKLYVMADYSRFVGDASADRVGGLGSIVLAACCIVVYCNLSAADGVDGLGLHALRAGLLARVHFTTTCDNNESLFSLGSGVVTLRDTVSLRHRGSSHHSSSELSLAFSQLLPTH